MAKVEPRQLSDLKAKKSQVQKPSEMRIDEQLYEAGKYEVTKDDCFKINFGLRKKENRWVIIAAENPDSETDVHWVEFRMWTFDEDVEMRKKATMYDASKRVHYVDNDLLNRMKIQKLLKAWSFEEQNANLKLLHVNGVLVDESYDAFKKLQPSIARYIIEKMNDVLEYND